jgi:small subunit ribosomal protein S18
VAARATRGTTRDARSSAGPRKDRKGVDRRRRSCFFCREKIAAVDYKNIAQLRRFISERGKIKGRGHTGTCRKHQKQVAARSNARARWRFCPTSVIPASRRRNLARATPGRSPEGRGETIGNYPLERLTKRRVLGVGGE